MEFTEIPFNLAGRVYRSAMPFGIYDLRGEIYPAYRDHQITSVVVLVKNEDIPKYCRVDLLQRYRDDEIQVLHFPIQDFSVPDIDELRRKVDEIIQRAKAGENIAIHCSAGVGRTGMLLACMAKQLHGLQGEQAVAWVRSYVSGAVETRAQREMVDKY